MSPHSVKTASSWSGQPHKSPPLQAAAQGLIFNINFGANTVKS